MRTAPQNGRSAALSIDPLCINIQWKGHKGQIPTLSPKVTTHVLYQITTDRGRAHDPMDQ